MINPHSTVDALQLLAASGYGLMQRTLSAVLALPRFALWVLLATIVPLLTTLLVALALVGGAIVLFFGGLLHVPAFQAGPILAISIGCLAAAALLNALVTALSRP